MEGRWTIFLHGIYATAVTESPALYQPRDHEAVPVVPCDDASIEHAVEELIAAPFDWRTYSPAQVVDVVARALAGQSGEEIADAYLRAAGETP